MLWKYHLYVYTRSNAKNVNNSQKKSIKKLQTIVNHKQYNWIINLSECNIYQQPITQKTVEISPKNVCDCDIAAAMCHAFKNNTKSDL